MPLTVMCNSDL